MGWMDAVLANPKLRKFGRENGSRFHRRHPKKRAVLTSLRLQRRPIVRVGLAWADGCVGPSVSGASDHLPDPPIGVFRTIAVFA